MTFSPAIPMGGVAGLRFIDRTYDTQRSLFAEAGQVARDVDAFKSRIGAVSSAAELVNDPPLLRVALGAFGLEDDAFKKAFIRRVIEDGTTSRDAFANRLVDKRYRAFAQAFDFSGALPERFSAASANTIADRFLERQFERSIGQKDEALRLALNFRREAVAIAKSPSAERTGWFELLGQPPLREVIESALGLPQGFSSLDLDRQKAELESRALSAFGFRGVDGFRDSEAVEQVVTRFLAVEQSKGGATPGSPGANALVLLSGSNGLGSRGGANLILSLLS